MRRKFSISLVAITAGTLLAACQPASVSGGGTAPSAIRSGSRISLGIQTQVACSTPSSSCEPDQAVLAQLTGDFRDEGTSAAWPYGVQIGFTGKMLAGHLGVVEGAGETCTTNSGAPDQVSTSPDVPTTTCYVGVLTYRSKDLRNYPNSVSYADDPRCRNVLEAVPLAGQTVEPSNKTVLSGLALTVVVDSDKDGRPSNGDQLLFVAACGPYADRSALPDVLDGTTSYNYGSCNPLPDAGPLGGVFPSGWAEDDAALVFLPGCLRPLVGGNLKVTLR